MAEEEELVVVHAYDDNTDLSSSSSSMRLRKPLRADCKDEKDEEEEEEVKPERRLLTRRSSMRIYVVDPYFKLATLFQPVLECALEAYAHLDGFTQAHHSELTLAWHVLTLFFGLLVTFYGSRVSRTVSFLAAFRNDKLWDKLYLARQQIAESTHAMRELTSLEEEASAGFSSQLRLRQRSRRRLLAMLDKLDPELVSEIMGDCWRSVLFAGATAKLSHAKTISLGLVLGEHINRPMQRYLVPLLQQETRSELAKWYCVLFMHACHVLGVFVAFQLEGFKFLVLVSTSVKGAHMMVNGLQGCCCFNLTPAWEDLLVVSVCIFGLAWQSSVLSAEDSGAHWILHLGWFPVFVVEHWLIDLVKWM